jgi:uncharacterized protein YbjT (DUF2867 family)
MANHDLKPTLVMGARGSVGKRVLGDLIALGQPVRASVVGPSRGTSPPMSMSALPKAG